MASKFDKGTVDQLVNVLDILHYAVIDLKDTLNLMRGEFADAKYCREHIDEDIEREEDIDSLAKEICMNYDDIDLWRVYSALDDWGILDD